MKLVLLSLTLLVVLARADNEDGVVYDAFTTNIESYYYMTQKYAVLDFSFDCVEVSQEAAFLVYNLDFTGAVAQVFRLEAAAKYESGTQTEVFVRLDSVTATPIASVVVVNTGSTSQFELLSSGVSPPPTGVHRVYLTFSGNAPSPILNLRAIQFG